MGTTIPYATAAILTPWPSPTSSLKYASLLRDNTGCGAKEQGSVI